MVDPYAPPAAELDIHSEQDDLAGRGARLAAAIVDTIIAMLVIVPLMYAFGAFDTMATMSFTVTLLLNVVTLVIFTLVHGYLLKTRGQTIGKSLLGIKIVALDGHLLDLPSLILKRYAPVTFANVIPFIGGFLPLIDVLFIFRRDRRCVHDHIAGTKVVKA